MLKGWSVAPKEYMVRRRTNHGVAIIIIGADDSIIDQFVTELDVKNPDQVTELGIFDCPTLTCCRLSRLLAALPYVENVVISSDCDPPNGRWLRALQCCPKLRKVQLGLSHKPYNNITEPTAFCEAIASLVVECRRLTELQLHPEKETKQVLSKQVLDRLNKIKDADITPRTTITFLVPVSIYSSLNKRDKEGTNTIVVKQIED